MSKYKYLVLYILVVTALISTFVGIDIAIYFILGCGAVISFKIFKSKLSFKDDIKNIINIKYGKINFVKEVFNKKVIKKSIVDIVTIVLLISAYLFLGNNISFIVGFGLGVSSLGLFLGISSEIQNKDVKINFFESYASIMISALTLGYFLFDDNKSRVIFPLVISSIGIIVLIIERLIFEKNNRYNNKYNVTKSMISIRYRSYIIISVCSLILSKSVFGNYKVSVSIILGVVAGILVEKISKVYNSYDYKCMIFILVSIFISFFIMWKSNSISMGLYGITLSALGMILTTLFIPEIEVETIKTMDTVNTIKD